MKAISIRQPFATLILLGARQYEPRSWSTRHRGPLLIHAARPFDEVARRLCYREPFHSALKQAGYVSPSDLPRGALLGIVELCDCLHAHVVPPATAEIHCIQPGRYAWLLKEPRRFPEPVPMPGRQGIYDVADDVLPVLVPPGNWKE